MDLQDFEGEEQQDGVLSGSQILGLRIRNNIGVEEEEDENNNTSSDDDNADNNNDLDSINNCSTPAKTKRKTEAARKRFRRHLASIQEVRQV